MRGNEDEEKMDQADTIADSFRQYAVYKFI